MHRNTRAFTLVEALAVISLLGIMAAGTLPIVQGVATNAAASDRLRRATESNAFAMDRVTRMLRDVPAGTTPGTIALASASAKGVELGNGQAIEFKGDELLYQSASGDSDVLATNVSDFQISYLASDGTTSTLATPETTQRFLVRCVIDGFELRVVILPRARLTQ